MSLPSTGPLARPIAALAILFQDDLGQDRSGQVVAALGIMHHEMLALPDHAAQIVQRDVAARARIVQATVGVHTSFVQSTGPTFG